MRLFFLRHRLEAVPGNKISCPAYQNMLFCYDTKAVGKNASGPATGRSKISRRCAARVVCVSVTFQLGQKPQDGSVATSTRICKEVDTSGLRRSS